MARLFAPLSHSLARWGSQASFKASATRFTPITVSVIARPGKTDIYQATNTNCWASLSIAPQLTTSGSPSPRKLRPASIRIALPT